MAKKFAFATYDRKHLKNLLRRAKDISSLFSDAAREGARIGEATGYTDPNGEFAFDKFPAVKQRVEELFRGLHDQLLLTVTEGNREEWLLSAAKNDALVESKYSRAVAKLGDRAEAWTEPHLEALEQFNKRKERGMNLSDRVWRLTDQFKSELELALEMGLGDGKSAAALSRDVREYLNEPHKLFRRVRNEKGQLRLSKAAAAYHPGQGVYRSSYKNALRLTATENNMAYRTADHERWNDLDFVIGIEIMLSNNHPVEDICDEMCGVYPKTFKFVGWHPFCRCIAVPKLADEDEFIARQQALIDGEELPQGGYSGEVTEMPQCFTDWVQENAERIETAKSTPYFIADNRAAVNKALQAAKAPTTTAASAPAKRSVEEIAAERHAKRDEEAIQEAWNKRRMEHFRSEQDRYDLTAEQRDKINDIFQRLEDANFFDPRTEFNPIWEELQKMFEPIRKAQTSGITISTAQQTRLAEFGKEIGVKQGRLMTAKEADVQSANPNWKANSETSINCQTCAPAYVLRSQGFDVYAGARTPGSVSDWVAYGRSFDIWENQDGTAAVPTKYYDWMQSKEYKVMNPKRYKEFFEEQTKETGIYILTIGWKGGGGGHATILQRFADGSLAYIEPQRYNGKDIKRSISELCDDGCAKYGIRSTRGILRVDDKLLKHFATDPKTGKKYDIWSIFRKH